MYIKTIFIFFVVFLFSNLSTIAQTDTTERFAIVENMPRFPGCETPSSSEKELNACSTKKMLQFIYSNIKYPDIARENGVEGVVVIRYVIEKDGSISTAEIVRDIGAGCGIEALRVVELMPKWIPGMQKGQPVRVQFNLPITFKLEDNNPKNNIGLMVGIGSGILVARLVSLLINR